MRHIKSKGWPSGKMRKHTWGSLNARDGWTVKTKSSRKSVACNWVLFFYPRWLFCGQVVAFLTMNLLHSLSFLRGRWRLLLFVDCLTSQQHASVSQGRICSNNWTRCHTEIEVADQTFYLTQSHHTDIKPISPSTDPTMPDACHG